jgi:agmatinase
MREEQQDKAPAEPERGIDPHLQEQYDMGFSGAGLASFGQRPYLADPEQLSAWDPDVAIVGAPFDMGATYRPGARFGPRALRSAAYTAGWHHIDLGIDIFQWLEVVDFGDAWCPQGQPAKAFANIYRRVGEVARRQIVPVILGGDHSVTYPAATAVAEHQKGRMGVVHFDAHADTAEVKAGSLMSHGTPMRRLIESGAVRGENFVQVGLRGYWPPKEVFDWMADHGMRWHLMNEIWDRGINAVLDDAVAEALDGADVVYLSVDIDVLDPGFAPGIGTPEPGGMAPVDLLRCVRRLALETEIAGMDIVEVAPPYDVSDLTANAAHRVVFEFLAGLAERRRSCGGDARRPG